MVKDAKQPKLHDLKPVMYEDVKDTKYIKIEENPEDFKRDDYSDSEDFKRDDHSGSEDFKRDDRSDSEDFKQDDHSDSESVDVVKDESEDVIWLENDLDVEMAASDSDEQDYSPIFSQRDTESPIVDPQSPDETPPPSHSQDVEMATSDEQDSSPVHSQQDTESPIENRRSPDGTPPLSHSQDVEVATSDEQDLSPVHSQKDTESLIENRRSPDDGVNTDISDEQSVLDDHAELFTPPPRKRRRVVLEAVVLPTLASVRGKSVRQQPTKEDIEGKLKKLVNPNVVKKLKNMDLSIDTVRERLRDIGYDPYPVPLDRETQDITVTRQFISAQYGGNPMETFPKVSEEKLAAHGLDDFAFLNPDMNPQAPQIPGAPGLFFAINPKPGGIPSGGHKGKIWRLFTRLRIGIWLYCGQYEAVQAPPLTKEEWADQKPKVRRAWAKHVCTKVWGRDSRARIHLRQELGREPTVFELNRALKLRSEYTHITTDQVSEAFLRGEETMAVYTLQCVGYDAEFQRNLAEKSPDWIPPPPKPKGEKKFIINKMKKPVTPRKPKRTTAAVKKRRWKTESGQGLKAQG